MMDCEPKVLEVPFKAKFLQYQHNIRYSDLDDAQKDATRLFKASVRNLKPKVLYRKVFIDKHSVFDGLPSITIEQEQFVGSALAALEDVHRVIAYVATCGYEMEEYNLSSFDFLAPYWLDTIKMQALGCARQYLYDYCAKQFGITKALSLNPGSGNVDIWPIEQMQGLFRLLRGASQIGVQLTESSLMIPNKSIAGLLFASSKSDFDSCAYCDRNNCPSRRVER